MPLYAPNPDTLLPCPFRCFRREISCSGSDSGSDTQFAICRTGLTRLNFIARSGVVSGQSSSKMIGILLARSNSFNSAGVNVNSLISSFVMSAAFVIINTSFETGGQPCGNQPGGFSGFFVFIDNRSLCIHYKQGIVRLVNVMQIPNNS